MAARNGQSLNGGRKIAVLLMPWVFLVGVALVYNALLIPRIQTGSPWIITLSIFLALTYLSFLVAAVTFSRDVLKGRFPS